jgi:hypothetical protein
MQISDEINQENNISYFVIQPVSIFRTYTVNLEQFNAWNYNGSFLRSGVHLSFTADFTNKWGFQTNLIGHTQQLDTRLLRGGPDMLTPPRFLLFGGINSDRSKRISMNLAYQYEVAADQSAWNYSLEPGISARPLNTLKIGISASYSENHDQLQYVETKSLADGSRYILGTIDQNTLALTFRIDYSITPELSIQYYGSPFISKGKYKEFKNVTDPMHSEYEKRYTLYPEPESINGYYQLDENGDHVTDYTLENPDFDFYEFRSNLVAKWQCMPGSFLYFVWSSERTGFEQNADASLGESFKQLWGVFPGNIFLVKFNYWFSL